MSGRRGPRQLTKWWRREGTGATALALFLLGAALVPLVLPYLAPGFQVAHDRAVPFMRVAALAEALHEGQLPPRWFPQFDGGYGSPYPSFYAMGFYYLSVLLAWVGLAVGAAVETAAILILLSSALAMYLLVNRLWGRLPALAGAVLYSYAPYHLVVAFERGAYSELTAFLWFPLITLGLLGLVERWRGPWLLLAPISIFGLLLSHNIMPMVFLPTILLFVISVGALAGRRWTASVYGAVAWAFLVAGLLASLIWLPILLERSLIHTEYFLQFDYRGDFVGVRELLGLAQFNQFTTAIGLPHLFLAGASAAALALYRDRYPRAGTVTASLVLGAGFAYLTNHRSDWLWQLIPPLQYAQFPWRMLAPASFFITLSASSVISLLPKEGDKLLAALATASLSVFLFSPLAQISGTMEQLPTTNSQICQEVWGTQDYRPIWSEAPFWRGTGPPEDAASHAILKPCQGSPSIDSGSVQSTGQSDQRGIRWELQISTDEPATITIPQFYYPGWQAVLDGRLIETSRQAITGLLQVKVPAGDHELEVRYRQTTVQRAGTLLFVLGGILLLATPILWPAKRSTIEDQNASV